MKKDGNLPRRVRIPQSARKYTEDTLLKSRILLEKPVTAQDKFPKRWLTQISFEGSNWTTDASFGLETTNIKNAYKHPTTSCETAFIHWCPKVRYSLYFHLELDAALHIYQSVSPVTPLNVNGKRSKKKLFTDFLNASTTSQRRISFCF